MSLLVSSSGGLSSLEVSTGNLIKSYNQSENTVRGIAVIRSDTRSAVSLLAIQQDKPLIHHYSLKKEKPVKRIVTPGKFEALAVSPDQQWLAAGSKNGSLYVWNLWSGALKTLHAEAHFQAVTDLAWSRDSSVLVTGGADARVLVWRLIDLISNPGAAPVHTLSTHSLSVVSTRLSAGTFRECRLYTASLDATVCVFDVFTGRLLYTLACDSPIHALEVDPAERALYLGAENGVHMVPLYYEPTGTAKLTAVGCADGSVVSTNSIERVFKLGNTGVKPSALTLSTDSSHLFVGCDDGSVSSWEVGSGQLVKKFRSSKGRIQELVYEHEEFGAAEAFETLPVLQRNPEPQADLLDFVPRPSAHASSAHFSAAFAKTGVLAVDTRELDEIDESSSAFGNSISHENDTDGDAASELEDLKQRHDQLKKMYDALWARQTSN